VGSTVFATTDSSAIDTARRSWSLAANFSAWLLHTRNVIVGAVKKSMAAMASRWFRRKTSQRLVRSGSLGARFIQREMVLSERSKPKHEELAMDARGAPSWILNDHLEDQLANLLRRLFPSDLPLDSGN
jgi:hypothetical protein